MKHVKAVEEYIVYVETIKRLSAFRGDAVVAILSAVVADVMLQLTANKHGGTDAASAKKFYNGAFKKAVDAGYPVVTKMHELHLMHEAQHETKQ